MGSKTISRGFILTDGEGVTSSESKWHVDIALEFLRNNNMLEYFEKSEQLDVCDFMVFNLHAIKVGSNLGRSKVISFVPEYMSKEQWEIIRQYQILGYKLDMFCKLL